MRFDTSLFFLFFGLVLLAHRSVSWSWGRTVLILASYGFYATAKPFYCVLLFASTLIDFYAAQWLSRSSGRKRSVILMISLAANLGMLGYFKYADFLTETFSGLFEGAWGPLGIVLPVGISFYTFQSMSYTIDVYRRDLEPTDDFRAFMLYVCFFPQLVAGPIERAGKLLPQLATKRIPTRAETYSGIDRILVGLAKKILIADRLRLFVDPVYAAPHHADASLIFVATLAFSFQLYFDFSAYTDIALGVARLLGVKLSENFNRPLLADSPADFWRRWHITLSQWFRDYPFRAMGGGDRKRPIRTMFNYVVMMTLIGFWHGASWTFVLFGFVAGLELVLFALARRVFVRGERKQILGASALGRIVAVVLNFFCIIMFTMTFFRADSVDQLWALHRAFWNNPWTFQWRFVPYVAFCSAWLSYEIWLESGRRVPRLSAAPVPLRGLVWVLFVLALIVGSVETTEAFVYFQF